MTPGQEKALLANVLELMGQQRRTEGLLEGLSLQAVNVSRLMEHLRVTTVHLLRLMRQKEALLEAVGRRTLERAAALPGVDPEDAEAAADVARAFEELRRAINGGGNGK
jgi:hypothetical protein